MALAPGSRLGPYEVTAQIGAGGMGEVYRARDTKLNRDVALKILPEAFTVDGDRIARFRREAQVLASLNHPNIAAIYGFEDSGSRHALILELVEGPTLADRIAKGPIPLDEALPIAKQIAEALEAAHEQGMIHRDLKPANIKLRDDGTVKVLDFGLAKALEPVTGSSAVLSQSPTITTPAMTGVGIILGTAAYMSPEQARGRAVDKRTDVWAFGCVLYEMLSGRRAFDAEDVSMTLAAVMMKAPDWSALPDTVPAQIRSVIKRCLEKDRQRRVADIAVAQFLMNEPPAESMVAASASTSSSLTRMVAAAMTVVAALGAGAAIMWWYMRPAAQAPVRFVIVPPANQPLSIQGFQRDIAITPDGRAIVYRVAQGANDVHLAVRALDQLDARILPGITVVRSPFVSPNGQWIGFFEGQNGQLKKVSILGGPPVALCKYVGIPLEGSWGADDTIIFATNDRSTGLMSVGAGGGDPKVLTTPDVAAGETDHLMPSILPGGRAVLFTILRRSQTIDNAQIAVLNLKTGRKKILIQGGSDARYVETGHLIYAVAGTLRAVRFDLQGLAVTGDPVPVVEGVTMSGTTGTADYAVSQNGTLVYAPGAVGGGINRTLVWADRQGREEPIKTPPRAYIIPRISPDGTRVALDIRDQENDIWVWDLKRETLARVTFDPGLDQSPVWTPDGRRLIFGSTRGAGVGAGVDAALGGGTVSSLYSQAADNTGTVARLTTATNPQAPMAISPDATHVLFMEFDPKTGQDIKMADLTKPASQQPQTLIQTPLAETNPDISPDGRWVAYQSSESGANQVYVRPFPKVDAGHWQISTDNGLKPVWSRNGRELFYMTNTASGSAMMAVAVQTAGALFSAGNAVKLFDLAPYYLVNNARTYDVSANGRFLLIKDPAANRTSTTSLVVVEHWTQELEQRVPAK